MNISAEFIFRQEKLHHLIADLIGIDRSLVIKANQQLDVTDTPFYVTVQKTTSTAQGSRVYQDDNTETEYSKVTDNVLYSIQVIGKGAIIWADRLKASLLLTQAVNELKKMNIGILQASSVRDLSMSIDSGYEERAQFDLLVSQSTIVKNEQYNILSAEIDMVIEQ